MHTVKEQSLDVNVAIHFLIKEECVDSQDSHQSETDTHVWIKQESLDKCHHFAGNCECCVNNCNCVNLNSVYNGVSIDCTSDFKTSVNDFNAGIDNFECDSKETCMGIVKSRQNGHHSIEVVESELEYNSVNMIKRPLSPQSDSEVKYSFGPVKKFHVRDEIKSCEDRVYNVNLTDVSVSSAGDLLTPIRSERLELSEGTSEAKRRGRPPSSSKRASNKGKVNLWDAKIASVKRRGRPSKGGMSPSPKSKTRLSAKSTKSLSKVLKTPERKSKVSLSSNTSLISKAGGRIGRKGSSSGKLRRSKVSAAPKLKLGQDLVCRWCGLQCTTLQALSQHSLQHQEAKTFFCSLCDFTCQYLWMLHSHRSIAHPELVSSGAQRSGRTYRCQACQYTCHKVCMLKRHMLIHLQLRPYACKLCPFTCNIKYNLKLHMMRHTRERPYECKVCRMRFGRSYTLTAHSRVHTGEKPHACDRCNFTCAYFSSMKRHRLQHENKSERLCCPTCEFGCKLLVTFLKHRVTEHNERGLYMCHLCHAGLDNTKQLAKHLWKHKKEGRYGDNEQLFRLPKYLVRIRNKKELKVEQVAAQPKVVKNVLNDASNKSISKLIIKNLSHTDNAVKKSPAKAVDKVGGPAKAVKKGGRPAKAIEKFDSLTKTVDNVDRPASAVEKVGGPAKAVEKVDIPAKTIEKVGRPAKVIIKVGTPAKAVKKVGRPAKLNKIIRKSEPIVKSVDKTPVEFVPVPIQYGKVLDVTKVPTFLSGVRVVCRKLTISEIIRRRVDNKL